LAHVERLARFSLTAGGAGAHDSAEAPLASVAVPGGVVEILPSEAIDVEEVERRRGERRRALEAEVGRAEQKLANRGFVEKAPAAVVDGERDKLERFRTELAEL
jgi:valyl-tRNA synthetase